jgi:hypothetical protein
MLNNILVDNFTSLIKYQGGVFVQGARTVEHKDDDGNLIRIICDMNENNSTSILVDEIDGFVGNKYKYVDGVVVDNPDYVEPKE